METALRPTAAIEIGRCFSFRQAVHAPEIAAVSDAYPQVAQDAAMRINEQILAGHGQHTIGNIAVV
jgi:hypothetical protein